MQRSSRGSHRRTLKNKRLVINRNQQLTEELRWQGRRGKRKGFWNPCNQQSPAIAAPSSGCKRGPEIPENSTCINYLIEILFALVFRSVWSDQYPPGWGAIRKWPLIRSCQTKVTSDQTIPRQNILWSDYYALETPCALEKCARICLWSDLSRRKWPLIRPSQTIVQMIVRSWTRPNPDHRQTIVRSKSPLIRQNCARNSPISEWFCAMNEFL